MNRRSLTIFTQILITLLPVHDFFPVSDNFSIFLKNYLPSNVTKLHKISFRHSNNLNKQSLKISNKKWMYFLLSSNVIIKFTLFLNKIQEIYNKYFSLKAKYVTDKRLNPWITRGVLNSIKTKNELCKDFKTRSVIDETYKHYRNALNTII